jgi:hypothetical protein
MIYDKARMAKLSGLMTESSHKGIKNSMAHNFGGGKEEGDPWLDGDVTTEGAYDEGDEGNMMHMEDAMNGEEGMGHEPMEARRKKGDDDEEKAVREMIRTELRKAKKDVVDNKKEENAVREAVRKEIRSVLRSRGVAIGGTGVGFRR